MKLDRLLQLKRLSWQDDNGYHERYGSCEDGWYIDLTYVPYDGLPLPVPIKNRTKIFK